MKEMLSSISVKFIHIVTLLAALFFAILYALFVYQNPTSIYNEWLFRTLALCELILTVFMGYCIYKVVRGDSMFDVVQEIITNGMTESSPIFNTISDGIIVVDKRGVIKNINQGLCSILGIQENKILGRNIINLYDNWNSSYENKLLLQILVESLETQKEFRQVERMYTRDDEKLHLSVSTHLLRNKYKRIIGVLAILHDFTYEKKLEQHLLRAEKLVNAGQMAAELAHEIKNPICSIRGLLQMMGRKHCLEESKYYEVITSEIDRISALLQRFLTLTQDAPKLEKLVLNHLIEEVVPLLESYAEFKNIDICVDMQKQIPCINADAENIKQVIINIVQNGIDALPEKGRINISIWYDQIRDLLRMEFKDNGSGIKPEHLDKIFEPFFTTKDNGSGLGLAISHKIIENHQGKLFAFNNLDGGATFVIELPIAKQYELGTSKIS